MDKKINQLVKDFVAAAVYRFPNLQRVYLFGSYAKNIQGQESDIDVALIFEQLEDHEKFDTQVELMLLAADFDTRIEPHPLSEMDFEIGNPFVSEIKKTGVEIFKSVSDKLN